MFPLKRHWSLCCIHGNENGNIVSTDRRDVTVKENTDVFLCTLMGSRTYRSSSELKLKARNPRKRYEMKGRQVVGVYV